jgi:hypothetical protein
MRLIGLAVILVVSLFAAPLAAGPASGVGSTATDREIGSRSGASWCQAYLNPPLCPSPGHDTA